MKNKSLLLLKVRFISHLGLNTFKLEKDRRKKINKIMITIVIAFAIIMAGFYSGSIAYGLVTVNSGKFIPIYSFILCTILTLFFTIFKANGELFAYKDYDIIMSLPIKTSSVISSRFAYLYIWNTFLSSIIMISMGGVYAIYEKPNILFYMMWFISILAISLIPTTIATIIGAIITAISSKFRHSNIISTVLTLILLIGIFAASMIINNNSNIGSIDLGKYEEIISSTIDQVCEFYPIAKLFNNGLLDGNIVSFFIFNIISILWYYIFIKVLSIKYKTINTSISTYRMKNDFKIEKMEKSNIMLALYKKELKRFLSSTVYVVNIGMGIIMSIIFSVTLLLTGPEKLSKIVEFDGLENIIVRIAAFLISAIISMTCTTCVALSLEGKNLWIIKSLPLTSKNIFDSKILVNLTMTIPVSIICGIIMIFALDVDFFGGILLIVTPIMYSFLTAVWGIYTNNRFPNFNWETETQVVKQSLAVVVGMFGGCLMAIIPGVIISNISIIDYRIFNVLIIILIFVITILLYKNEIKRKI